ncbi:MAG TPA: TRAP transporter substrate-binding protein [Vicinamibacterales bacterium]|nr:TRAP transporter substrate-binding protein [Vicinamibacterales bacterium]
MSVVQMSFSRRSFLAGAALGSVSVVGRLRAAEYNLVQYHNQTASSSLHRRLVEMWETVRTETKGRVEAQVLPQNNNIAGSDPAALAMLVSGEIHFFTLMGGILGTVVPVAEVQQVPFAFRSAPHAHDAMDGPLGAYVREEMTAKGIHGFAVGAFDNGMRQIAATTRAVRVPADLMGIRMRVPAGQMVADTFTAFGAVPVTINSSGIYDALKTGKVDAQENPLALIDSFKLYEVSKYVSMTNHMWSGFNQLAHLPTWQRLPGDIKTVIDRNVTRYVRLQREDQERSNGRLRPELTMRGLAFNDVDAAPFRRQLAGFYATWKKTLGPKCWSLLEAAAGSSLA